MRPSVIFLLAVLLVLTSNAVHADVIDVPDDFETIQEGIDEADNGDTVLVAHGEYVENINFNGKNVVVIGDPENPEEVVIDGDQNGSVVTFENGETEQAVLTGFTITNGSGTDNIYGHTYAGGILCFNASSPTLLNLIISQNSSSEYGGGMACFDGSNPILRSIVITGNSAVSTDGGGIYCYHSSPTFESVLIYDNSANHDGGGLYFIASNSTLTNVTITGNIAEANDNRFGGGAMMIRRGSTLTVTNSVFWDNDPQEISYYPTEAESQITVSYSDVSGGENGIVLNDNGEVTWGDGNIDEDPLFVDSDNGDYHLTENSPCIDTGDPNSLLDPDWTRADMGAYYFEHELPQLEEREFEIADGIFMTMVLVPSGEFAMGSPDDEEPRYEYEGPVHEVTFANPFWIGKYEITQEQWESVMGENPANGYGVGANYPIYNVSWDDVQDFETTLGNGFRLPSESEWEYSCRASTQTRFYWGYDHDYSEIDNFAIYVENNPNGAAEVGTKLPNAWGLYDMSGNVWEWCEDWFHEGYENAPDDGSAWVEGGGTYRVGRGASRENDAWVCRSTHRNLYYQSHQYNYMGLRLARNYQTVELASPNGGEEYEVSELATITWETEGDVVETKVYYSLDGGDNWTLIVELEDETETEWRVPYILTDECVIKVVVLDENDGREEDISDNFFSIIPPTKYKTVGPGWSLISIPLLADDMSVSAVLRDDLDQQAAVYGFTWERGMYIPDELEIGEGYIVGTPSENVLDITGMPNLNESHTFELRAGWNLLGSPFRFTTELSEADVTAEIDGESVTMSWDDAVEAEIVTPVMFNYFHNEGDEDNGHIFLEKQRFRAWHGYWYLVMYNVELTVYTPLPYPAPGRDDEYDASNWHTQIIASSDGLLDDCRLGVAETATDGFDNAYDYPEPPAYLLPIESPLRVFFVRNNWHDAIGAQYNRDIREPLERGETGEWLFNVQPSSGGEVTLTWPNLSRTAPYGDLWYDYYLIDEVNERSINMRLENSYRYEPDGEQQFTVRVLSALSAPNDNNIIPNQFGLTGVYPNPFNATTKLSYGLPSASNVTIRVFNLSGQVVSTLVSGNQSAGTHSIVWDGTGVVSGIYFVRMEAGDFVDTRKLTLMK